MCLKKYIYIVHIKRDINSYQLLVKNCVIINRKRILTDLSFHDLLVAMSASSTAVLGNFNPRCYSCRSSRFLEPTAPWLWGLTTVRIFPNLFLIFPSKQVNAINIILPIWQGLHSGITETINKKTYVTSRKHHHKNNKNWKNLRLNLVCFLQYAAGVVPHLFQRFKRCKSMIEKVNSCNCWLKMTEISLHHYSTTG